MGSLTFETLSTCFLQELLLLAVVRDVSAIVRNVPNRVELERSMLFCYFFVLDFAGCVSDLASGFPFGEYGHIFAHLLLFSRWRR